MRSRLLQLRFRLIPTGSRRERTYHALRLALLTWKQAGARTMFNRLPWMFDSLAETGDAAVDSAIYYQRWIRQNEPNRQQLAHQRQQALVLPTRPLISILTPVYNPPPAVLADTIRSVLAQTYDHWELCLADGGSDRAGVRDVLDRFAAQDTRIRVVHLSENRGISANSNAALEMAGGEFVALLDHDDLLAPNMLFEIAQHLNQAPETDLIYYDEDKISADGRQRSFPWFKPTAWSPDLLLSTNYWMHSVIRRALVAQAGGFDEQVDGAQDWDLALRLADMHPRVSHLARLFYHWRQVPGSAASDASAKPWAFEAQLRCIRQHLERQGIQGAQVEFRGLGTIHVRWPTSGCLVSILIPTKDKVELLRACLTSIFEKTAYPNYEILILDTGSQAPETLAYYETLKDDRRVRFLSLPGPFNFHTVNNAGARQARGDVLVFLNNDTEALDADWLDELVGWAERPQVGAVGAKLLRPDGTIQHGGIIIGLGGHGSHLFEGLPENSYGMYGSTEWYRDLQALTGACLAMRRQVFEQIGGFDEIYRIGYGDIDLCLRAAAAGYRVVYTPFARLLHHEGGTRGLSQPLSDVLRATASMGAKILAGDPFYNPNLSNLKRIPGLAQSNEPTRPATLLKILSDYNLVWLGDPGCTDAERWRMAMPDEVMPANPQQPILFVTHELSRTGAPIILWEIAKSLQANGYKIRVISPFDGPLRQAYEEIGIPVRVIPWLMEDARLFVDDVQQCRLVVANTMVAYRAIHAAQAWGKPSLWYVHESGFGLQMAQSNPSVAQAFQVADAVLFPVQAIANLYQPYLCDNQHVIFTGVAVAPPEASACANLPPARPGVMRLVTLASIEQRKGQDVLLQAIAALPPEMRSKVECFLVGRLLTKSEKAYCQQVEQTARRLGNVHVVGDVQRQEALCYVQSADAFILPSRDEALPISIIEAMGLGKAVIATRVGGVAEIIQDGENGLLVEAGDFRGIAMHIQSLYAEKGYAATLGQQAQAFYHRHLTYDVFYRQVEQLIQELLV